MSRHFFFVRLPFFPFLSPLPLFGPIFFDRILPRNLSLSSSGRSSSPSALGEEETRDARPLGRSASVRSPQAGEGKIITPSARGGLYVLLFLRREQPGSPAATAISSSTGPERAIRLSCRGKYSINPKEPTPDREYIKLEDKLVYI